MASTSTSSLNSGKPERSFSFKRIRGALRRPSLNSKLSLSSTAGEGGRKSLDSQHVESDSVSFTSPKPEQQLPSPPSTPDPSNKSFRSRGRQSTDQPRQEPKRSASVARSEASVENDPSSKRAWSVKKVKGALKRTASRLSVGSAKHGEEASSDAQEPVPDLPTTETTSNIVQTEEPQPIAQVAEPIVIDIARETVEVVDASPPTTVPAVVDEPERDPSPSPPRLQLEASQMSSSSEWERVEMEEPTPILPQQDDSMVNSDPVPISAVPETNVIPPTGGDAILDVTPVFENPRTLVTLQPPIRSEAVELSPIVESPLREERETYPTIQIVPQEEVQVHQPSDWEDSIAQVIPPSAIEPEARYQYPPASSSTSAELSPTSRSSTNGTSTPNLNAIELGAPLPDDDVSKSTTSASTSAPSESKPKDRESQGVPTLNANFEAVESPSTSAGNSSVQSMLGLSGLVSNAAELVTTTAWFVGACVVVGVGMVIGQARSYRQNYGSPVVQPVRRWFVRDWWRFW
ncbi:hypothetical protein FA15DRAFT_706505 [Coprinopsis marcescibilis]|uniref:Uncharacterized protein n=1 Tax=Coprinopsis marcescibilis TaxID=230819 RepID=A0A5C3L1Y6_COPMA|nr:hypothetical protein FA15DRAFT_706505 [Coprinopsis marcescibilis]